MGLLFCKVFRADGSVYIPGKILKGHENKGGFVSEKLITDAWAEYICRAMAGEIGYDATAFKYHAMGTDATGEVKTQTSLLSEVETRVAGSQAFVGPNMYQTVATLASTATQTIKEHGIFSAATGGTMMDRSVLSPTIPVFNGDFIEFTYIFSMLSGG